MENRKREKIPENDFFQLFEEMKQKIEKPKSGKWRKFSLVHETFQNR